MSGFSNYLADRVITEDLDGAYVGLFVGDPTDTGSGGVEASATIGGRELISLGAITGTGTRTAANDAAVDFGNSAGTVSGSVSHFGLFDALTGGNLLFSNALITPQPVVTGNPVSFEVGVLTVSVT